MITVILVSQSQQSLLLAKAIHKDKKLNNKI